MESVTNQENRNTGTGAYTLITGACGVLGGAFVELLAERGEPLFLTGRSARKLEFLRSNIKAKYPQADIACFPCNLASEVSRRSFFAFTDAEGIAFKRLIYVAGADIQKAVEKYTEQKLVFQTRVNFEGAVSFTRAVLARTTLNGDAEFLAIGSMSGICPMPHFALYSATKKALEQFYSALRVELKGRARVTCVLPGAIPTREDVKANIEAQGFWTKISVKTPQEVAEASLKAVARNKRRKVIGFWNHVYKFVSDITPMPIKLHFIKKRWEKLEKDAF